MRYRQKGLDVVLHKNVPSPEKTMPGNAESNESDAPGNQTILSISVQTTTTAPVATPAPPQASP